MADRYDVVSLERVDARRWRATGYRIDEQGKTHDDLVTRLPDGSVKELWIEAEGEDCKEVLAVLRKVHPDLPPPDASWSQVQSDPERWRWSHERHKARRGSPENPHVCESKTIAARTHGILAALTAPPASQQELAALIARIESLERTLAELQARPN
jgi:hypothetical protein